MKQRIFHPWNLDTAEAKRLQNELAQFVVQADNSQPIEYVGGVDVAYSRTGKVIAGAAVVLRADSFSVHEKAVVISTTAFPYLPGFFAFREMPVLLAALQQLKQGPARLFACPKQPAWRTRQRKLLLRINKRANARYKRAMITRISSKKRSTISSGVAQEVTSRMAEWLSSISSQM